MSDEPPSSRSPNDKQIVAIIGGAVAGSEAAFDFAQAGIHSVVIEQNPLPYGKIEDGLPIWHVKQRQKEMDLIDSRIGDGMVSYVPSTKFGDDISFKELYDMNWSAILLANGAWKDRPFPIPEIEQFEWNGFYYQNAFVHWFNHYREARYHGEDVPIVDSPLVVGGGLASIDVVKILQLEEVTHAMQKRGTPVDIFEMEHKGIPATLAEHGLTWDDLGLEGCLFIYRRDVTNMPLVAMPPDVTPEREEKIRQTRQKILNNARNKYLFHFQDCTQPMDIIVEDGKLVGLKVIKTEVIDGKAVPVEGSEYDIRSSLIVSSIGSVPEPISDIPMHHSTYDIESKKTGHVEGLKRVFSIGNALTGKGNIRVSRINARDITKHIIENELPPNGSVNVDLIQKMVKQWQTRIGYKGDYTQWIESHRHE